MSTRATLVGVDTLSVEAVAGMLPRHETGFHYDEAQRRNHPCSAHPGKDGTLTGEAVCRITRHPSADQLPCPFYCSSSPDAGEAAAVMIPSCPASSSVTAALLPAPRLWRAVSQGISL